MEQDKQQTDDKLASRRHEQPVFGDERVGRQRHDHST
jgi:hypothetical protein